MNKGRALHCVHDGLGYVPGHVEARRAGNVYFCLLNLTVIRFCKNTFACSFEVTLSVWGSLFSRMIVLVRLEITLFFQQTLY